MLQIRLFQLLSKNKNKIIDIEVEQSARQAINNRASLLITLSTNRGVDLRSRKISKEDKTDRVEGN